MNNKPRDASCVWILCLFVSFFPKTIFLPIHYLVYKILEKMFHRAYSKLFAPGNVIALSD